MNCIKCYQEISDDSKFCPHCGAQQPEKSPVHAEAGAAADPVQPAEDAVQQTENTVQQTESTAQQAENNTQQTSDPGYQYQQSGSVYQSEPTPIYQQPVNHEPVNWIPYLVLSIISTVCCCLPFGIVAIVFAAKINSSVTAGDYEAAEKAAKTAKIWIIVAVAVGIVWNIIQMVALGGLMDMAYYYY